MHPRISINSLCFMGSDFPALASHWKQLGARKVSLNSRQIREEGLEAAQAALATGDYEVELISHQFVAGHLEPREEQWEDARSGLSESIGLAQMLGASAICMVTGGHGTLTWEEAADCFSAAIAPCVGQAAAAGVALTIECAMPVYAHSTIVHSLRDTVKLAELAGIGVCIDVMACWTESALRESIERAISRCPLMQIGDYVYGDVAVPARAVPGDGVIPLERICGWAVEAGFKGTFDLELLGPRIDREGPAAIARAAANFSHMLEAIGA